ncbi:MAG: YjbH domain-containing protein [Burkholderiales bacterium]
MRRLLLLLLLPGPLAQAAEPPAMPSLSGQTGLLAMPDARMAPDGTWRAGYSFMRPYHAIWSSLTAMPWLEGGFRYTRIQYVPGFSGRPGTDYGDYKDKSFDAKLRVLPEMGGWPQIAVGAQDVGGGTGLFSAYYAVASKQLGELDLTLGYGKDRIDGAFGGVRWSPRGSRWSLVAEYDAYDYPNDRFAAQARVADREKGGALGLEYRGDNWGAKAFAGRHEAGVNAWVEIPLAAREFVPKLREPPPYTRIDPRPTQAQWAEDAAHEARLRAALRRQGYENVATRYAHGVLEARLANPRIAAMPRAVGRAARTMLALAPLEVRELRVTYLAGELPVATYEFADARLLQRYFNGLASREMLARTVAVDYAQPGGGDADAAREEAIAAAAEPLPPEAVVKDEVPQLFGYRANLAGGAFRIRPGLSIYFNDPSGAFKYDLSALATWDRRLAPRTYFNSELKATLIEDVSDVTQPSNSLLPHVRTDVAEYKRGNDVKLLKALFNRYFHPGERLYARASLGIYEEMYSGGGGQLLWLSKDGGWAADVAVDALRQRDFEGWLGHRDYETVTAIGSLHYRMASGLTATVRAGRFLAKDEGVRMEMKRRFASGFEVGAWYTVTNGNDVTSPGTPASPYYDKGIFMRMALNAMLTKDTRATANIALSPWTRDVGQMVVSPGDLARLLERDVVALHDADGLRGVGDRDDDYAGSPDAGEPWPGFVATDAAYAGRAARRASWTDGLVLGTGLVLSAAVLDKPADRYAKRHADERWLRRGVKWGDALPIAAMGFSGLFAIDESRPRLQDAGIAALEAGALAIVGSEVLKRAAGRARPGAELGPGEFEPGSSERRYHAFPSRHAAVMWAAVTPYAKEFGRPWLYGLAALTNAARAAGREHWVSDTVAGSLLGYWLGTIAWEARRESRLRRNEAKLLLSPDRIDIVWSF